MSLLQQKRKCRNNVNIVKGFTIIADLKHESKLWKRSGDICFDSTKPATA